jgi:hypothetical protein
MTMQNYSPGTLISARGREWIVLTGSEGETLHVRPLTGSEADQTIIDVSLELEPVRDARFALPTVDQPAGHDAALLLRDTLVLSLRRGAGPFRGFGQIAVEPRAYQLVPLIMALKLDPVRLLIADDVGIGKTIEAGLIARELLDRGDVERFTVLCPPHLVDQWVTELEVRFHLRAAAITAQNAKRLEDSIPPGTSVFELYPYTVVSLDYIKSQNRREHFLTKCPELVIVDEAHACTSAGEGRHQRYELLHGLAESKERHLVLLTATPHSGDETAFFRLLGLLSPDFLRLQDENNPDRERLRERLARHFVQRRRPDIAEWHEARLFPERQTKELTYALTGPWEKLFDDVLDYCAGVVEAAGPDERRQRLNFWGTLALMRCVASSPAAAVQALRTRAGTETANEQELRERVLDGTSDTLSDDDVEPPVATDDPALAALIAEANALTGQGGDPKLKLLAGHLDDLVAEGFHPVVFCRYIATAHYLGKHLSGRWKDVHVGVVTGELTSDERRERVQEIGDHDKRVLIATDCLSEGVNLQDHFTAVVHYDLSWNPTRHEQREGRVDRFGQKAPIVRATLIWGVNNPVDGAVLDVIVRKAAKIREELGVPVPVPDDSQKLTEVLLKAVLLKRRGIVQAASEAKQIQLFESVWETATNNFKKNRAVFAQRRLKPTDVLPEWQKTLEALGSQADIQRFTGRALARLGSGLDKQRNGWKAPLSALPDDVKDRLAAEGLTDTLLIDFAYPAAGRCQSVQRSHPLVAVLAETLLERTLAGSPDGGGDPAVLGRVGAWIAADVTQKTHVVLLRLRHQLITYRDRKQTTLLVEEAVAAAWDGTDWTPLADGKAAMDLLAAEPLGEPPQHVRARVAEKALQDLAERMDVLDAFAQQRAQVLLNDHRRVREAADARGQYAVNALLPPDVIGLFVLLPPQD